MDNSEIEYCNTSLFCVLKKIKNRKLLREFLFSIGWYIPNHSSFNHEFVFLWLQNKKNVSKLIIYQILKLNESHDIILPSFNLIEDLSKTNLLLYCLATELRHYFPDNISSESVSRNFILKVIYHKDNSKFITLQNIAKKVNEFKMENQMSTTTINIPKIFMNELEKFQSLNSDHSKGRIYSYKSDVFSKNNIIEVNLSKTEKKEQRKRNLDNYLKNNNIFRNEFNQIN